MDAQENIGRPAINFGPYNSTSVMPVPSPTTLPAKVVAEVFPITGTSLARPSRRSTSTAVGSVSDGSGRLYNCPEIPMAFCDSPLSRFCTGHCRTNNLYLQQLHLSDSDKADVVRFLIGFLQGLHMHLNGRFVSHLLKIPKSLGILQMYL